MANIRMLRSVDAIRYVRYNYLCNKVHRVGAAKLIPLVGSSIELRKDSSLNLEAPLALGTGRLRGSRCNNLLRLDSGARLDVRGGFSIFYGGDVIVFDGAHLEIGSGFANSNLKVRCMESITIGSGVALSHDVTIMDTDAHELDYCGHVKTNPVVIGDGVWIGSRAMILKGVNVGDGSVVGAGSVVTRDIPPHSVAVGNPARVVREDVTWR